MFSIARQSPVPVGLVTGSGAVADEWLQRLPCEPRIVSQRSRGWMLVPLAAAVLRESSAATAVVVFNIDALPAVALIAPLVRIRGGSCFLDLHNDTPTKRSSRRLALSLITLNGIVAVSRYVLDRLGSSRPQIVVHRPIPVLRPPTTDAAPTLRIAYVGRIDPEKRIEELLIAFGKLDTSSCSFSLTVRGSVMIEGDGYSETLLALSQGNPLISFEGKRPWANAMDDVDLLVAPNPTEPSGRAVAEAQRCGIPAIVPDLGGSNEFVERGVSGEIYRSGDPDSLARAIERIASKRSNGGYKAAEIAEWAEARYNEEVQGKLYYEALDQLSGRDSRVSLNLSQSGR